MIRLLRNAIIVMLLAGTLLRLPSCRLEESYKKFNVQSITYDINDECFDSEEYSFARIRNVVFIPEIKAVNHEEYVIYVSAYSKNGKETVQIKNVVLKEQGSVLFSNDPGKEIEFEKNGSSVFEGHINGGTIAKNVLNTEDGKKYDLVIEAAVIENGSYFLGIITFKIDVMGYKSVVWPT